MTKTQCYSLCKNERERESLWMFVALDVAQLVLKMMWRDVALSDRVVD